MSSKVAHDDVVEAAARIKDSVIETPLVETTIFARKFWLKCENLQTGGAFKLRGATNRLLQLDEAERARGVVAFSSGNHAQGIAIAARRLGIPAVIVMPADAPSLKIEGTRAQGAEIIFYNRKTESREEISAKIAAETGAVVVPSFDDPAIVAGQGTVGLEILAQLEDEGAGPPSAIVIPVGGGGLAAGIAIACPHATIVGVEPEGWDDMANSVACGTIVPVGRDPPKTFCDALQTPRVSPITFGILRDRAAQLTSVDDSQVGTAIRWLNDIHGMIVEPGGAVALAAVLAGKADLPEGSVIILSGGNIDPALHGQILERS